MSQAHVWCPWRPEKGIRSPVTGVMNGCEPPCRFWEPNTGPLGEQQMFLSTEPGLLPKKQIFKNVIVLLVCVIES